METEPHFNALRPEERLGGPEVQQTDEPIQETPEKMIYLGVGLEKAQNQDSEFVPKREQYADFVNDKELSLPLQRDIAVNWLNGDPMLVEGGTSLGKTTSVRKMCADLGYEVHYINLNGATDVEDLMGKYVPNAHRVRVDDSEYIFADGRVTSGLRQEDGKVKVVILDELNAAAPNITIRLHEVLDALERNGEVILSEDASEAVSVDKAKTKIIGLMNPPGKGYLSREPMDPAQLRRWVYKKLPSDLPESTFSHATDVLFGLASETEDVTKEMYLVSRDDVLSPEQLAEIPGMTEISQKYKEFHKAAKELLKNRNIAEDQPQPFTFDDRMEPRRVRNFVLRFYNGDVNETFQQAMRYYYSNKLENEADRRKLEELIAHIQYSPPVESRRKGPEREAQPEAQDMDELRRQADSELADLIENPAIPESIRVYLRESLMSREPGTEIDEQIRQAEEILGKENVFGPEAVLEAFGATVEKDNIPEIPFSKVELERAKELNQFLVLRINQAADGQPLTMQKIEQLVQPEFDSEGKGKVLYPRDWYKTESFFTTETPDMEWALTTRETIPNSKIKNYLEQTQVLADYLENQVFAGEEEGMPSDYNDAIAEFTTNKDAIKRLMESDWKAATQKLSDLKINQLTRQSPVEAFYDELIYFQSKDERILEEEYTWTNARASDGRLVHVGSADAEGAGVSGGGPGDSSGFLGVSFSRSR